MVTEAKKQEVEELKDKFDRAQGLVLSDYRGISATDLTKLRESFTKKEVEYRVVKNTLAAIAAEETGLDDLSEIFDGPIAMAVGYDDPVLPFKISSEVEKEYDAFSLKGGMIEGDLVESEEIETISNLSSREELLANLAVGLKSPMQKLAYVLKVKLQDLTRVLDQLREQKEG